MRFACALAAALSLTLVGCSYHHDLKAVELDGTVAFVPANDKGTGCFAEFKVTSEAGEVVWELETGQYSPPPCDSDFPVVYGRAPKNLKEAVKAKPLRAGVLYKLEAWDGDDYSGAFRLRQAIVIDNFKLSDDGWQRLTQSQR